MPVTEAVQDGHGITHTVVLAPSYLFVGCTACGIRFWVTGLWTYDEVGKRFEHMAKVEANVDCISCLVILPVYDSDVNPC